MSEEQSRLVEVVFDNVTLQMLEACAAWRNLTITELARAYVEDWLDVDYPQSQGRLTRRGIHRDGPIGLDSQVEQTSRPWQRELMPGLRKG